MWIRVCLTTVFALGLGVSSTHTQAPSSEPRVSAQTPPTTGAIGRRHPEEGRPFVRAYRPAEVGGDGQNWTMLQDGRGVIYSGTNFGIIEYDGVRWRLIDVGLGVIRSLAMDAAGTIFVGAFADFGYLKPDSAGTLQFVSLHDKLPAGTPSHSDVWRTFATPNGVYFVANQAIFHWAGGKMTVIPAASRFNRASFVNDRLYVPVPESGLNVLEGGQLKPLPGTAALGREVSLIVLPYDKQRVLVGTRSDGLFLHDGTTLTPFQTEVDGDLKIANLYRGTVLPDGTFAIATLTSGLFVLDREGRQVLQLSVAEGLPSEAVTFVMPDRDGGVWVASQTGLARLDYPAAASTLGPANGYRTALSVSRHGGRLYTTLSDGIAYLEPAHDGQSPRFVPIAGPGRQCWQLEPMPDPTGRTGSALALACNDGLFEIRGTTALPVRAPRDGTFGASALLRSRVDPTRLWIGLNEGLASYRRVDGQWIDEGRVPGISENVRSLGEDQDGTLWLGIQREGVVRVSFASPPLSAIPRPQATGRHYGEDAGFDGSGAVVPTAAGLFFASSSTRNHITRFDRANDRFVRDEVLSGLPFDRFGVGFGLIDRPDGTLLASFSRSIQVLRPRGDGGWDVDTTSFARLGGSSVTSAHADPDGVVWLAQRDEMVRVDLTRAAAAPPAFQVLVRGVSAGRDQIIFGGAGSQTAPTLPASTDALRFEYAAPTFIHEDSTEYQTRLEGLDSDWSPWSREAHREFTNVSHGTYRFQVRARAATGQVASSDTYAFTILPPWYATWAAWLGFIALAGLVIYGSGRLLRRRVVLKERERAAFAEARLRADAAEQLARTESEGKKQVELLSEIGREITASLDIDTIFGKLYERVNQLADADVFGVGLYYPERHELEYRLAIEDNKRYAPYSRDTRDRTQLPVWCIEHRTPVVINDLATEYGKYVEQYDQQSRLLEDGSMSKTPQSLIYVPLLAKDRVLGVITIQSFEKHAYDEHHLNLLQSLASYTAVALDNASAYRQLNEQEHEIRRLFESAERARAAAEEADAAKSAFLSTVSHELRTPLTSVLGFAKIIKKRLDDRIFPLVPRDDRKVAQTVEQVDENLKVVVSEGERLTKLIDDVLDLAKIEAGKLEWHMGDVSIEEIIDHATAATSSLFDQKGLGLVKDIAPGLPNLTGDRDRLVQVVINLISNAVKFTESGTVTCRAAREGHEIVVRVVDTGLGIAPADQPKVFERFKQVGDTLTDKPKGTGLGLPICKEIVEHHHGRIWVESAIGHGSTFAFSLPTKAAGEASDAPVELAALIRQLREQVVVSAPRLADRKPRILVVDDEANIRELLTQEFTEAGYAVTTAANGRAAVASVRAERPDVIVLDVMMPEMNGFDVAAVLKNDPATLDIPIVILSIVQNRERGYRVGVDRYLTKPIDTDLLFREVGTLLEQKTSHKRVLVVDEDASTVKSLTDVLATRGYTVVEASGAQAVERALAMQPDIILLNAVSSEAQAVRMLRFEKDLEHVLFLVYQ